MLRSRLCSFCVSVRPRFCGCSLNEDVPIGSCPFSVVNRPDYVFSGTVFSLFACVGCLGCVFSGVVFSLFVCVLSLLPRLRPCFRRFRCYGNWKRNCGFSPPTITSGFSAWRRSRYFLHTIWLVFAFLSRLRFGAVSVGRFRLALLFLFFFFFLLDSDGSSAVCRCSGLCSVSTVSVSLTGKSLLISSSAILDDLSASVSLCFVFAVFYCFSSFFFSYYCVRWVIWVFWGAQKVSLCFAARKLL